MEMIEKADKLRDMGFEVVAPMTMLPYFQRGYARLTLLDVDASPWEGILEMIAMQDEMAVFTDSPTGFVTQNIHFNADGTISKIAMDGGALIDPGIPGGESAKRTS